jgi:mRNA-degrading endonuclease RelE of RelBE toxin-antitoxin system
MHEQQAEAHYVRIKNNALSEIQILEKEIQSAISKYNEAVEKNEPEPVKKAIQRNIDYFNKQIKDLTARMEIKEKMNN